MKNTDAKDKVTACRDNHGLGSSDNDKVMIGYISEVNGLAGVEVPEFVPTRHELLVLIKHWLVLLTAHMKELHEHIGGDYESAEKAAEPAVQESLAKARARLAALVHSLWH